MLGGVEYGARRRITYTDITPNEARAGNLIYHSSGTEGLIFIEL